MPSRILVVPDKFKGTLTARGVAEAIARGWQSVRPSDTLSLIPMSDGGDGFGEVLSDLLQAESQSTETIDAAGRPCRACWSWHAPTGTAIVESARVIGLAMLPRGEFHPLDLDTRGLATVLRAVSAKKPRRCLIGIGGSATNDGGFGLARGLGWQFLEATGLEIRHWGDLANAVRVIPPEDSLDLGECIVGVDVQNPLLGPQGCSRIYGPQKGLRAEDFPAAEAALGKMAALLRKLRGTDVALEPGTGAAGGLGFGLRAFCGGNLEGGFKLFADLAKLSERLAAVDFVLTGEGAIDEQTLMGKGVGELALLCQQHRIPCYALAGVIPQPDRVQTLFAGARALTPGFVTRDAAWNDTAGSLEKLAASAAREWRSGNS